MAKIIVKQKAEVIKEYFIQPFKPMITVGSEANNDLVIDDKKVSMNHLKIEKIGLEYYLTDLNSAFGTFMRGRKVEERTRILQGDEIKIGEHSLQFLFNTVDNSTEVKEAAFDNIAPIEEKDYSEPEISDLEGELAKELAQLDDVDLDDSGADTMNDFVPETIKISEPIAASETKAVRSAAIESTTMVEERVPATPYTAPSTVAAQQSYYLLAIYGPYKGKKFQLNFNVTRIGRDTSLNDIVIRKNEKGDIDPSVSRRHASITYRDGRYFVSDRRSKTRTFVNQLRLSDSDDIQLMEGDEIEIVSDQKSTIFRFVREGNWDISSPKKSGVWWVRYSNPIIRIGSVAMLLFSLLMIYYSVSKRSIMVQKPSQLAIAENIWLAGNGSEAGFYMHEVGGYNIAATPAIADINGDGFLDYIFFNEQEKLRIINGRNQEPLWSDVIKDQLQSLFPPILADLNGNQKPDIIVLTKQAKMVAMDGTNGAEIWTSPILSGPFSGPPTIADVNGDGLMDMIICSEDGKIHIGVGSFGEPSWIVYELGHATKATPVAADLDRNRRDEIIIGTEDGYVLIFNSSSGTVAQSININEELNKAKGSYSEDNQIRSAVAVGDLNNDRILDLMLTTLQGNVLAINGKDWKRFWYDVLYQQGEFTPGVHFAPAAGDVNGDGILDLVVCTPNGMVRAYQGISAQGDRAEVLWEFSKDPWESFMAAASFADINKDGCLDVITCGAKGGIRIMQGTDGTLLWQTPQESELVISAPLIGDLKGDGLMDIVYLRSDNAIYQAKINHRNEKNYVFWGQFGGNAQHTFSLIYKKPSALGYTLMALLFLGLIAGTIYLNIHLMLQRLKLKKAMAG